MEKKDFIYKEKDIIYIVYKHENNVIKIMNIDYNNIIKYTCEIKL